MPGRCSQRRGQATPVTIQIHSDSTEPQRLNPSHPPDLSLTQILVQPLVQMLPPFKQHRMADQLEPRRKLQALILEHLFQLLRRDISRVLCLVRVSFYVHIGFDEENVINYAIYSSAVCALCESE